MASKTSKDKRTSGTARKSETAAKKNSRPVMTAGGKQRFLNARRDGIDFRDRMYVPTLVEVPIAKMFLSLGMHRGPLLAYLMADPELSLQSILMISVIIGRLKSWTYVGWVALFSTLAGLIYGAWVDGTPLGLLALYLGALIAVLGLALWLVGRRNEQKLIHTESLSTD